MEASFGNERSLFVFSWSFIKRLHYLYKIHSFAKDHIFKLLLPNSPVCFLKKFSRLEMKSHDVLIAQKKSRRNGSQRGNACKYCKVPMYLVRYHSAKHNFLQVFYIHRGIQSF